MSPQVVIIGEVGLGGELGVMLRMHSHAQGVLRDTSASRLAGGK